MISRDPIAASERRLQPPAKACAVDRGDNGHAQLLDRIQEHLTVPAQTLGVRRGLELQKFFDVSAGDPDVGLAAQKNGGVHGSVALQSGDQCDELVFHRAIQFID